MGLNECRLSGEHLMAGASVAVVGGQTVGKQERCQISRLIPRWTFERPDLSALLGQHLLVLVVRNVGGAIASVVVRTFSDRRDSHHGRWIGILGVSIVCTTSSLVCARSHCY